MSRSLSQAQMMDDSLVTMASGTEISTADIDSDGEFLDPDKISKYKLAAGMATLALEKATEASVAGAAIHQICSVGDDVVSEELAKVYNRGQVEKGPAFPTCVSPNNIVAYNSPGAENATTAAKGDLLKICCGVQVDGMIATIGTSVVVGGPGAASEPSTRALQATRDAAVVVNSMLKPGTKSTDIVKAIAAVAAAYGCEPVGGVCCGNMKRFVPVGNKRVLIRPVEAGETCPHKEFEIEDSEVYDVDIAMSTGSGLPRMGEIPTTVFRRDVHRKFNLRMKAARHVYAVVDKQFPTMPFAVRQLGMPKARLGIKECISQEMVFCYDTMYERPKEVVASYRFTAIVRSGKTTCLTAPAIAIPGGAGAGAGSGGEEGAGAVKSPLADTDYGPIVARSSVPTSFSW